ncbi:hypothetical protein JCM5353_008808 [Sporobolomyces roseus]
MPAQHDGRLLNNLINREKEATQAFKQYTLNSGSAAAALSTWSTADSGNTTDIMDASTQITHLLSSLTDTQRSYLNALTTYRSSLKEVLGREVALRTVVRDREILVNRVIKLGNKKPKDDRLHDHQIKLEDAQRELTACESFLQDEEHALSEIKRRSFREALAHRMTSMGELGRVMEDVAIEALDILAQLDGPDGAFNPDHYQDGLNYEIGSEAGESIAPFDSASQAMSRASSNASLDDDQQREIQAQQHQNAPPLPTSTSHRQPNGQSSSSHLRQSTAGSIASPPASRAPSQFGGRSVSAAPRSESVSAPSSAPPPPQPIMPPVPTAPRAISQVAYTERHEGLPTFDIPKAPDLSRRPDEDSSDEEDNRTEVRSVTHTEMMNSGVPAKHRSTSYPLDSPGLASPQRNGFNLGSIGGGGGRPKSMSQPSRRRAMSDSSSIDDRQPRQRKRSGSFFGGIAALFKRKNKRDDEDEEEEERERANPEVDYYEGRNRLASGGAWNGGRTNDDVMAAVMGAGVRGPQRSRGGGDSSDDDEPRNVVRNVNDPKQRFKAMSDVGRAPSSSLGKSKSGPLNTSTSRPVLTRKGTSSSHNGRPMSMIQDPVTRPKFVEKQEGSEVGGKKKVKKVKKAASDIGYSGGNWASTVPATPSSPSTNGINRSSSVTPAYIKPKATSHPAPPPVPSSDVSTALPDSGSIMKKKKKSVKEPSQTVILSAEALGIPSPAAGGPTPQSSPAFAPARPAGVSRSNTVTSSTSAAPKIKKKKKTPSVVGSIAEEPSTTSTPPRLPTADDLAKTLPTARSSSSAFTTQLPRPDDDPYNSKSTRPLSTVAPSVAQPSSTPVSQAPAAKPVKPKFAETKLAAEEKRSKRHSQLHGEGNWVSLPPSAHPITQSSGGGGGGGGHTRSSSNPRNDVHEGDESLLAAVERAGVIDSAKPSRTYTGSKPNSGTTTPNQASSPKASLSPSPSAGPKWMNGGGGGTAGGGGEGGLAKRKSVRLAENSNLGVPSPNPHHVPASPASSVRGSSPQAAPRPILVNSPARGPSPAPAASSGGGWPTRESIRASMMDSSDEEDGDGGYMAARRALRKETKQMDEVFGNGGNKVDKGKGKAVN